MSRSASRPDQAFSPLPSYLQHSGVVQLLWMNFSLFLMNERLSLTLSVSLWRSLQMNVWMDHRRDWQTAPRAFSPSSTHKLPSNHKRVGWLMLHTHTYILKPSQYSTRRVLCSSLLTPAASHWYCWSVLFVHYLFWFPKYKGLCWMCEQIAHIDLHNKRHLIVNLKRVIFKWPAWTH